MKIEKVGGLGEKLPVAVLGGGIVAIVVSVVLTVSLIVNLRQVSIFWAEKDLSSHTLMLGESVRQMARASEAILKSVADEVTLGNPADEASYRNLLSDRSTFERLEARAQALPSIDVVTIVDTNGNVLNFSRSYPAPEINLADRDYFLAHKSGSGLAREISVPVQNRGTGTWVFYQSRAIFSESGSWIGLVLTGLSQSYFDNLIQQSNSDESTLFAVFRIDGVFLAGSRDVENVIDINGITRGSESYNHKENGKGFLASLRSLDDLPIVIVAVRRTDAALTDWRSVATLQGGVTFAFSAIALIALGYVYRGLRRQQRLIVDLNSARESAQSASSYKSTFLANMSHELRTPLNAIIGFSEIIQYEILGRIEQRKYVEYARDIQSAGTHLLDLINEILDFSKIDAGRLKLEESVVDLHRVIERCVRVVHHRAESGGLALISEEASAVLAVRCDELRLRQIILNLLSNAIKFTPNGGSVSVHADLAADGVRIAISDTGIGMSEAEIGQALQPFVQVKESSHKKVEGTGLGLPIAKRLAELHGAAFELQSKPGAGTTVTIRLPRSRIVNATV